MLVSHVIPFYNGTEVTNECLKYLHANTNLEHSEIILIDDGSEKSFVAEHPYDEIITHFSNQGFPISVNHGIACSKGDYIAIWNNDLMVAPGWLEPILMGFKNSTGYGMLSPKLYEPSHIDQVSFFEQHKEGWNDHKASEIETWHKGCPWVFKREVFERVGLFDERFFPTQYEDSDMLLRMALDGYKHGVVSNTAVYHYSAYTQNKYLTPKYGADYPNKNRERFIEKWGTADISYENAYDGKGWSV